MFKIKPKINFYFDNNKGKINVVIKSMNFTNQVIIGLLDLFKFDKIVVVTSVNNDSGLLEKLNGLNIKYVISTIVVNGCFDIIFSVDFNELKLILNDLARNEDVYVYNINQGITWEQILFNSDMISKMSNLEFIFSLYEGVTNVSFDKKLYDSKIIENKIKNVIM